MQTFSQQEMSVTIKKMTENKAVEDSKVIAEYMKVLKVKRSKEAKRIDEWYLEWSRVKLLYKSGRRDEFKSY